MNKLRIQQLIQQVGTDTSGKWISTDRMDQLAELIVTECANICNKIYFDQYPDAEEWERSQEGDAIKQHFGIKL